MKSIIINIIGIIFLLLFSCRFSFQRVEMYWMIYLSIALYYIYNNVSQQYQFIFVVCLLRIKMFRILVLLLFFVIYTIVTKKYNLMDMIIKYIYNHEFNCNISYETKIRSVNNFQPVIYISNYPSNTIEYFAYKVIDKDSFLLFGDCFGYKNPISTFISDKVIMSKNYKNTKKSIIDCVNKKGVSVYAYIERKYKNRKTPYNITELRTGIFNISKETGIPICPVIIDHVDNIYGFMDNDEIFKIHIGPKLVVSNIEKDMKFVSTYIQKHLSSFKIKKHIKRKN